MPKGAPRRIALLGPPLIEVDGRPLDVDTRKATALLAYLAFTGRPARRDTLAGLLWPETSPDRARATLRRTLSTLKSALGGNWLDTGRDTVALTGDGIWLDVDELRQLVASTHAHGHPANETCSRCLEPLQQAAALDRGQFLTGFGLRDSAEFDDWQLIAGAELRREVAVVLDRLGDALAAAGSPAEAISCARRRLALDPLHEPAHRQLIRLLADAGDRQAAMEQYRECVRVLDRELGVRPLDETTALYHAIVEGTFATPRPTAHTAVPQTAETGYDLVGRDTEVRRLLETYDGLGPDGRLVALVGEAGIGKTRLGEELMAHVAAKGGMALAVRCYEEERGLAYGVVHELARGAFSHAGALEEGAWWIAEVARLVPELGTAAPQPLDSAAAQVRFYDAVAELLLHSAGPESAALFVDDAHWADESSLGLLAYLAHRLRGRPLLLAATWRPEEVAQGHPVRRLVADAQRTGLATVIELGRLSGADVQQLVDSTGRNDDLGSRLYRESGGLPFFVVEYLDALARGDDDESEWALPVGVRDLLERRLSGLGELSLQVLAAGAVLGRSFDPDTVRAASGRSDDEVVLALEQLVACGLLVEGADGALDFRHEQARDLVSSRMTLARRRLLHRRVAAELDGRGKRESQAAVTAYHLAAAGDDEGAAERYRVAGDHARRLFANAEALAHYRASLALGLTDAAGLHEAIGDLETLAGDYGSAFASYETAAALAGRERLPEIERRIGLLHLRRGEWELAEASLATASDGLEPPSRSLAIADRALAAHRMGDDATALELAEASLRLAEEIDDRVALAQAHNIVGMLAGSRGDHEEAITQLELGATIARAAGDAGAETAALNNLALAVRESGDADRAIELTTAALELCIRQGDRHREAALRNNLADLLRATGRHEQAMDELKHAVSLFAEIGEEGRLEPEIWKLTEW
jgi:DNA-binding SARP family transcriptional activator